MASRKDSGSSSTRRDFLKSVAGVGGVATASALVGASVSADTGSRPAGAGAGKKASKGYHVTPHIQEYYRIASML